MDYSELYDYLEGFEKSTLDDLIKQIVSEWNNSLVEAVVETLFKLTKADYFSKPSFYNFYSNSSLAGAPYPCSDPACRLNNIDSLARFSALYADQVLVPSPIDKQFENLTCGNEVDRLDLAVSIIVLLKLKPLVMAGIIGFSSSYLCLCKDCLKRITTMEDELEKQISQISKYMVQDLANSAQCMLTRDEDGIAYFAVRGLEKYGFHEQMDILIHEEPPNIKKLLSESDVGRVKISSTRMQELGLANYLLQPAINDIFQAQITTKLVDSSYLTTRASDVEVLEALRSERGKTDSLEQSKLLSEHLFHEVPIIGQVTIESIVKLRKTNEEDFSVYRDNINQILKDIPHLNRKEILEIQRDIIAPEIHKMEQTIRTNKNALVKSTTRDILLSSAGITIGLFSGLLPLDYGAVWGVLGGIPTVGNILSNLKKVSSDVSIKNNNFYFLWKLGKQQELI